MVGTTLYFPAQHPVLTADGLRLRAIETSDIPAWYTRATDVESADLAGDAIPASIDAGAQWVQRHHDRFRERQGIQWTITRDSANAIASDRLGSVGLSISSDALRTANFGVVMGRAHWGQGIATAASRCVLRYGFEVMNLAEIHAEVLQRNHASIRVLDKLGFRLLKAFRADDDEDCFSYTLAP